LLEPNAQFSENIVDEALIARAVYQPVQNVAVMRGNGIDVWWCVHILLPSSGSVVQDMSCLRSTTSTESAAICLRASHYRPKARPNSVCVVHPKTDEAAWWPYSGEQNQPVCRMTGNSLSEWKLG